MSAWEAMAEWYDAKQGDDGDLWHRALIDPPLIHLIGPADGLRVLDLACGNGYLARRFARMGARVIGVDASAPIVERARRRESQIPLGITYHVGDATRLDMVDGGSVDVVMCNMALMDIEDAAAGDDHLAQTPGYHRPLSWYFRTLRGAGFVITGFEEPEPTDEFLAESPSGPWIAEIPVHCVIEARKDA